MIRKPEQRKPEEIQHLKQLLMSMRSFREKYTDDMRNKMCEVVRYTRSVRFLCIVTIMVIFAFIIIHNRQYEEVKKTVAHTELLIR